MNMKEESWFPNSVAGWDAAVNQVAVRNCLSVGIKGDTLDSPIFFHL